MVTVSSRTHLQNNVLKPVVSKKDSKMETTLLLSKRSVDKENQNKQARASKIRIRKPQSVSGRERSFKALSDRLRLFFVKSMYNSVDDSEDSRACNDALENLMQLLNSLVEAERECLSGLELDAFEIEHESSSKKRKKQVRFAVPKLNLLAMPSVEKENTGESCFCVLEAFEKAWKRSEELKLKCAQGCLSTKRVINRVIEELVPKLPEPSPYFVFPIAFVVSLLEEIGGKVAVNPELSLWRQFQFGIETGLRYLLRKILNEPMSVTLKEPGLCMGEVEERTDYFQIQFTGDFGTYNYNCDDVSTIIREALVALAETEALARRCGESYASRQEATGSKCDPSQWFDEPGCVHLLEAFVEAHGFLCKLFSSSPLAEAVASHSYFDKVEFCARMINLINAEDQMAYLPIANLKDFEMRLRDLERAAEAAQYWLDKKARSERLAVVGKSRHSRKRALSTQVEGDWGETVRYPEVSFTKVRAVCDECNVELVYLSGYQEEHNVNGEVQCQLCGNCYHSDCLGIGQDEKVETCFNCGGSSDSESQRGLTFDL